MMKRILFLLLMLCAHGSFAQAPQGIPYQAVARNSSGAILSSTAISVRFTIRDSVATGIIKYRETFSVTTTAQGMFNVNVGQGTVVSGTFAGINWGSNAKFMQVELDPAGGSSYVDMGTTQMMSVPYALYAGNISAITVSNMIPPIFAPISLNSIYLPGTNVVFRSNILSDGGNSINSRGIVWSTSPHPTVELSTKTVDSFGTGSYLSSAPLSPSTLYYVRSYATNSFATGYSSDIVFMTPPAIGSMYLGGILSYIFQPGDVGYSAGETHGLIATADDQSSGIYWGCLSTSVDGTSTSVGSGATNTMTVSSTCGAGTAARICSDLVLGGYSDWYLPSRDELNMLYINRAYIGGFSTGIYWSSSQIDGVSAWLVDFGTGGVGANNKIINYRVRPVRSF